LQLFERLLDRRPDDAQPIAERFRPRIVALGLNRHDLPGQARHALLDSIGVDGEGSVRLDREGALIEKVVQLNRDPFSVRLAHAEADRAEDDEDDAEHGEEGGAEAAHLRRDQVMIERREQPPRPRRRDLDRRAAERALRDRVRPLDELDLAYGIGRQKAERYGRGFLEVVAGAPRGDR